MKAKRVTLFYGHYGSGKTNVAVSYAIALAREGKAVAIYDMDVVNPYYRTADAAEMLAKNGVRLVVGTYVNSNVEVPALPAENYGIIENKHEYAVVDVGGDDRGALALGRYVPGIRAEGDYEALLVVNKYRPETRTPEDAVEIMREIEFACALPATGLVNDSNLGGETTLETVADSREYMAKLSALTGLPQAFTAVRADLMADAKDLFSDVLPIELIKYGDWVY